MVTSKVLEVKNLLALQGLRDRFQALAKRPHSDQFFADCAAQHARQRESAEIENQDKLKRDKLFAGAAPHNADDEHQEQVAEGGAGNDKKGYDCTTLRGPEHLRLQGLQGVRSFLTKVK